MKSPGKRGVTAVDSHVGLRLRTLRLTLRIGQAKVADILGVTFQQIQKYEHGRNRITVGNLQKLATALKVPITYFFEGATHENVQGNDFEREWTEFLATPDGLALMRAFKRIQSKALRRVVGRPCRTDGKEALSAAARRVIPRLSAVSISR
jgi:transcriptional regulator with XRE-family HTH domain